ncbi:neuroendocrine convertase 1-like [Argiope bruennichi]|uniref:neuroendocrine convertase 1-like n=1 Tax=Argiope bruennichi TaxID=94029 RepID=UPI002495676E|nr:neuroendocrine convertase 1-like [Argiope bruennichi]
MGGDGPLKIFFYLILQAAIFFLVAAHDDDGHYLSDWVVRLVGGKDVADQLAMELDYQNLGELKGFPNTYLMRKNDHPQRSRRNAQHLTKRLADDHRVEWAEQQVAKRRVKREFQNDASELRVKTSKENIKFNDFLWQDQWYLHDTRNIPNVPELDMRTIPVWNMGYTGKGVVITIMDDGLEWNHTDIRKNYDPKASWDTNDDDDDPFPRYDESDSNNHGTRCAGEIAMVANNLKCGVGIAYNAKIGGIRMLDGIVNDAVESVSIAYNVDHIDIFSASWGPNDDGMTVDGPKRLAVEALEKGIKQGRRGKGTIYVWASGNGGSKGDNCNCDGYTNSIYTLSVGSASQRGDFPWYGERCASTMTTAYSSGAYSDQKIATTDLHNKCTVHHTGTSAAAPLAAGVIALVLEANPDLTWRDVQHLVVWTSEYHHLKHNKGWKRNSVGLMYNSRFGFGLINAEAMVKAALNWTTVPEKAICKASSSSKLPKLLSSQIQEVEVEITADGCTKTSNEINYLEHVELSLDIDYNHRGALDIYLFSPAGTVSMVLSRRERDSSAIGFKSWTFLSVHFWGENPVGKWKVLVRDMTGNDYKGAVNAISLKLHGTKERPKHMTAGRKRYINEEEIEKALDRTPEFEEGLPEVKNNIHDELENLRAVDHKEKLNWADLVGKNLRNMPIRPGNFPKIRYEVLEEDYIDNYPNQYTYY